MNVLVIGATGQFAGLVVPELKKKGVTVTALITSQDRAGAAIKNGADKTIVGSLENEASLRVAAGGMDGVFHIIPAFQNEVKEGLAMVNAAKAAGVKKFVFSSVYHPSLSLANHIDKQPAEDALFKSGMDYTILQPAMYMQMLAMSWRSAIENGGISGAYSKHSKMAYVDYRDVAEAAAIAMTGTTLSYGMFELAAPGMYSRIDLAAMMSKALGRPVEAQEISPDVWAREVKMPAGEVKDGLIKMNKLYDQYGFSGGNALVLKTILGREPRTVQQFIKELAGRGVGGTT